MRKLDKDAIAAIEEILHAGAAAEIKVVRGRVHVVELRRKLRHPQERVPSRVMRKIVCRLRPNEVSRQ